MEEELLKKLGKNIMLARKAKGLTQRVLADKLSINHANISRIESGEQQITAEQLCTIAETLNTTVGSLLGEAGPGAGPGLAEFTAWCEEKGVRADRYLELAMWLVRHLDATSREEALELQGKGEALTLKLLPMLSEPAGDAVLDRILKQARQDVDQWVEESRRAKKPAPKAG